MDNATQARIHEVIASTLRELGVPDARFSFANTTILIRDGFYLGHRLVCGHIQVMLLADGQKAEFYDQGGNLLRQMCLGGVIPQDRVAA